MRFVSLDVKTVNSDPSNICEMGIGVFEHGQLISTNREYIDPEADRVDIPSPGVYILSKWVIGVCAWWSEAGMDGTVIYCIVIMCLLWSGNNMTKLYLMLKY